MRVACMDTVNLCGGVMYKGFYYISLIKAGLYLRVSFIFWILQITLQKKKAYFFQCCKMASRCSSVLKHAHIYVSILWNRVRATGKRQNWACLFPPVAPILFCTFQMVSHHFWQDPQHHWLKCSINHIKASAMCYKWL